MIQANAKTGIFLFCFFRNLAGHLPETSVKIVETLIHHRAVRFLEPFILADAVIQADLKQSVARTFDGRILSAIQLRQTLCFFGAQVDVTFLTRHLHHNRFTGQFCAPLVEFALKSCEFFRIVTARADNLVVQADKYMLGNPVFNHVRLGYGLVVIHIAGIRSCTGYEIAVAVFRKCSEFHERQIAHRCDIVVGTIGCEFFRIKLVEIEGQILCEILIILTAAQIFVAKHGLIVRLVALVTVFVEVPDRRNRILEEIGH